MPPDHTDLQADRPAFPAGDLRDLLHAFHELSPGQTLLIERMKTGVFDTPAPERLAGRANSKRARPERSLAQQQLLSPRKSQSLLPLVVDYANALTQVEIAQRHGMHVQTLRK